MVKFVLFVYGIWFKAFCVRARLSSERVSISKTLRQLSAWRICRLKSTKCCSIYVEFFAQTACHPYQCQKVRKNLLMLFRESFSKRQSNNMITGTVRKDSQTWKNCHRCIKDSSDLDFTKEEPLEGKCFNK